MCGWRGTALHFVRPADVRRREPRARDILAIASQRHVLASADGWKVHHLTAQMDDLVNCTLTPLHTNSHQLTLFFFSKKMLVKIEKERLGK